jgi:hypothetical protein
MSDSAATADKVREVVGVFHDAAKLEAAAEALVKAGFAENRLSVMGDQKAVAEALGHRFEPIEVMEDDPRIPQRAFILKPDRQAAESAAFGLPLYVGAMGGALLVVASGGALAMVLLAAAAGGTIGGGLGAVLAGAIGKSHVDRLAESLRQGGVLLWVAVTDTHEESRASGILRREGGADVHAQEIERTWGEQDIPFRDWNPDPFLD